MEARRSLVKLDDLHWLNELKFYGITQRQVERRRYTDEGMEEDEIDGKRSYDILEKLQDPKFQIDNYVKQLRGEDFSVKYIQENGFEHPIVFNDKSGLGLRVPSKNFQVDDVRRLVGSQRLLDVMDVATQKDLVMTMKDWCRYFKAPKKLRLLNVISLEFSKTKLEDYVEMPRVVRELDWVNSVWPVHLQEAQNVPTNNLSDMKYPKVRKYVLMSVAGCYTDFHIDFGGTSVWYHILHGAKVFWLIPPTDRNHKLYLNWTLSANQGDMFLGDLVDNCYRVYLSAGDTFLLPTGWIHAVYTPEESLVFGGNFLHSFAIDRQLRVSEIEDATHVKLKFRYPFYTEIHWYVLEKYVRILTGRSFLNLPQNVLDKDTVFGDEEPMELRSLTKWELNSLKALLIYLTSRPPGRENIPDLIIDPGNLLLEAQQMLMNHDNDDQCLATSGKHFLTRPDSCYKNISYYDEGYHSSGGSSASLHNLDHARASILGPGYRPARRGRGRGRGASNASRFRTEAAAAEALALLFGENSASGLSDSMTNLRKRRIRCVQCEACLREDCMECVFCRGMTKFGGPGTLKKPCISRQCMMPVLPRSTICSICRDRQPPTGVKSEDPFNPCDLQECIYCRLITHSFCAENKYLDERLAVAQDENKAYVNKGVPNEDAACWWECPRCLTALYNCDQSQVMTILENLPKRLMMLATTTPNLPCFASNSGEGENGENIENTSTKGLFNEGIQTMLAGNDKNEFPNPCSDPDNPTFSQVASNFTQPLEFFQAPDGSITFTSATSDYLSNIVLGSQDQQMDLLTDSISGNNETADISTSSPIVVLNNIADGIIASEPATQSLPPHHQHKAKDGGLNVVTVCSSQAQFVPDFGSFKRRGRKRKSILEQKLGHLMMDPKPISYPSPVKSEFVNQEAGPVDKGGERRRGRPKKKHHHRTNLNISHQPITKYDSDSTQSIRMDGQHGADDHTVDNNYKCTFAGTLAGLEPKAKMQSTTSQGNGNGSINLVIKKCEGGSAKGSASEYVVCPKWNEEGRRSHECCKFRRRYEKWHETHGQVKTEKLDQSIKCNEGERCLDLVSGEIREVMNSMIERVIGDDSKLKRDNGGFGNTLILEFREAKMEVDECFCCSVVNSPKECSTHSVSSSSDEGEFMGGDERPFPSTKVDSHSARRIISDDVISRVKPKSQNINGDMYSVPAYDGKSFASVEVVNGHGDGQQDQKSRCEKPSSVIMSRNFILERCIWSHVFKYLNPTDLVKCIACCKAWRVWAQDTNLWHTISLNSCMNKLVHKQILTVDMVNGLIKKQPQILVLKNLVIQKSLIITLIAGLPRLQGLTIRNSEYSISQFNIAITKSPLFNLTKLELPEVNDLDDLAFFSMIGNTTGELGPTKHSKTMANGDHEPDNIGPSQVLDDMKKIDPFIEGLPSFYSLNTLDVSASGLTNLALVVIGKGRLLPNLKNLNLSNCGALTNAGILALITASNDDLKLLSLPIKAPGNLLSNTPHWSNQIESLTLSGLNKLTPDAFINFETTAQTSPLSNLVYPESSVSIYYYCPRLTHLDLGNCPRISNLVCQSLARIAKEKVTAPFLRVGCKKKGITIVADDSNKIRIQMI